LPLLFINKGGFMSLDRGKIIGSVLIWLGNTDSYNDTDYDEYKMANRLLSDVVRQVMLNRRLLFNAVSVRLNLAQSEPMDTEYKYNLPIGFLNHISPSEMRIEGKYIFSNIKNLKMKYCKKIDFSEIPDYMEMVLFYGLAEKMTTSYPQYNEKNAEAKQMFHASIKDLQANEVSNTRTYTEDFDRTRVKSSYSGLLVGR